MDDTQQSRASDVASAATRKRRSSILKSQRPARTPFSELEFNVATPTDTTKSRRVSFSRRTGVAEFVTNEATTTWKNFYEEHNKSLESSSNDSGVNASRQPVGHLGKRIFDQQFEEVEAVDFISGLANGSLHNVNFSQQLATLECTGDGKLTAPQNKFELSAFTEQSKLFGNDFTAPSIGENSGKIDINFSAIQQIEKDDLDEIEKDLERGSNSMSCHGPFTGSQNTSEYIEVDLNMTHVVKNYDDMSITDTVHSPVQDVSGSASLDKKVSLNNDWGIDKENIAVNPYAAPSEANFADDEPDQVLVFDGKRLTLQPDVPAKDKNYRQTLLPNSSADNPQRKTIVLNVNDDLPNFIDDMLNSKCEKLALSGFQDMKGSDDDISETYSGSSVDIKPSRKTIHDNTGNISMTCALPTNIICQSAVITQDNHAKRTSTVFNDSTSNISVTETVPAKLLCDIATEPERRVTYVCMDDSGNISITQAVPSNILTSESSESNLKHKTIIFDADEGNISATKSLSPNILDDKKSKRQTIVFDNDACNVSITQGLPVNIILPDIKEKQRTIRIENDTGNISLTQNLPTNVIPPNNEPYHERAQTVIYEDDSANISVIKSLHSNVLLDKNKVGDNKENLNDSNLSDQNLANNISAKHIGASRRRTIVFEDDAANISITQAIPTQFIPGNTEEKVHDPVEFIPGNRRNNKRTTIVYDDDTADVSMTEAIPTTILDEVKANKTKTVVYDGDEAAISVTLAVSTNMFLLDDLNSDECIKKPEVIQEMKEEDVSIQDLPINALQDDHRSTLFDADCDAEMSMTMAIPKTLNLIQEEVKSKTVVFDEDSCNISMTKPITAELLTNASKSKNKSINMDLTKREQGANLCPDVIVLQASTNSSPLKPPSAEEQGDLKSTRDIYKNMNSESNVMSCFNIIEDIASPLQEEPSSIHPKLEMKEKQLNLLCPQIKHEDENVSKADEDAGTQTLNESLVSTQNMSATTLESTKDKNIMAQINLDNSSSAVKKEHSTENIFYIMKDTDVITQTGTEFYKDKLKDDKTKELAENQSTMQQLEYKGEDSKDVDDLQRKLIEMKVINKSNMLCETATSPDLEHVVTSENSVIIKEPGHSIMKANDTKELLEMLSFFADNRDSDDNRDNKDSGDDAEPALVASRLSSQSEKNDIAEPRHLSFGPRRQSIALSREDLLNNISMAHAALQKSRIALDDSSAQLSPEEDSKSVDMSPKNSGSAEKDKESVDTLSNKSVRSSYEVVKTLKFDDESISEMSVRSEDNISPLKKSAFCETSFINEPSNMKGKVIPTYLKDVSDGIKELMMDLVKPMADNLPFESVLVDRGVAKNPSTQSTQVQANLITSSQVDLDCDLMSNIESNTHVDAGSSMSPILHRRSRSLRSPVKFFTPTSEQSSEEVCSPTQRHIIPLAPVEGPSEVLIFDHLNPLNNVLLGPLNNADAHKYDPKKPDETPSGTGRCHSAEIHYVKNMRENECEMENVSIQHQVNREPHTTLGDIYSYKEEEQHSLESCSSKPCFTDQSSATIVSERMDCEVNTLITMKQNKDLLEGSSSLTLVDDAELAPTSPDHDKDRQRVVLSKNHLNEVQVQAAEISKLAQISLSEQQLNSVHSKGKKRIFSPSTDKYRQPADVTPKPTSKMQKISNSPKIHRVTINQLPPKHTCNMEAEKDDTDSVATNATKISGRRTSIKDQKPGHNVTVQHLIADCHNIDGNLMPEKINSVSLNPKSENNMEFTQSEFSFSSSNNLNSVKNVLSTSTSCYRLESNLCESESAVNVVAKIDTLPFMGSYECEWESSAADTWSFRLLYGRLRLVVRLAHRYDNAASKLVRGDTPVLDIGVDTVQHDRKNPVATLCVRFACDTIRSMISSACRGPRVAADVLGLLRRAAAAARVALRWGRAMHDAKMHLAYTLDHDGNLSLKVANVPLRSVWEVTMRIELVRDEPRSAPWPRAACVRMASVMPGGNVRDDNARVRDDHVRRLLAHTPGDWGHAPRTIWRIFRYLKHKTREDELLA